MRGIFFLLISVPAILSMAQCPSGKYGLEFNKNDSLTVIQHNSAMQTLASEGLGFLVISENWRTLQQKKDSGRLGDFVDKIRDAKTNLGFDSVVFIFTNPAAKSNYMPPVYCGNPWTDTHTSQAMLSFYTEILDSIGDLADYIIWGTDVDRYFKTRPEQVDSFLKFNETMSSLVHAGFSHIRYSTGYSYNAYLSGHRMIDSTLAGSDFRAVGFNPAGTEFESISAISDTVASRLNWLQNLEGLPWVIYNAEYPSSVAIQSSENTQKEFLKAVFAHTSPQQFEAVLFRYYSDFDSVQTQDQMNYYLAWNENAKYYFSSLGLTNQHGLLKEAGLYFISVLDSLCTHNPVGEFHSENLCKIYPNPFNDEVFILKQKNEPMEISILSQSGTLVSHFKKEVEENIRINTGEWAPGIYILHCRNAGSYETLKLLKF